MYWDTVGTNNTTVVENWPYDSNEMDITLQKPKIIITKLIICVQVFFFVNINISIIVLELINTTPKKHGIIFFSNIINDSLKNWEYNWEDQEEGREEKRRER